MDAHKKVEEIESMRLYESAKSELIEMASKDMSRFIMNCEAKGFRIGMKFGFMVGCFISLLIYLLFK